jgi:hypothetical protein
MDKSNIYFSNGSKNCGENARWNVNETILKVFTVRNKIKHWKKYKIGKSTTPLAKISIVLQLGKPRKRTIEILPSGVGDFPILYSPRC